MPMTRFWFKSFIAALFVSLIAGDVMAHGERAQLASMRMRTVHWFDTHVSPLKVNVGDVVTVTGKFVTSEWYPHHMPSIADTVFLNIGVPGPTLLPEFAPVTESTLFWRR